MSTDDLESLLDGVAESPEPTAEYDGTLPPLLQDLSYSSLGELHACARKFVLNKLRAPFRADTRSVTFAFGHAVGAGIQSALTYEHSSYNHWSEEQKWHHVVLDMMLQWDFDDIYAEEEKAGKSFWNAIIAVQRFKHIRNSPILQEYELLWIGERPATELSFRITTPDGYKYRGFVDVVLKHKLTGELLVLELKTTSSTRIESATYKNSGQALGYSVVLDNLAPGKSSYRVLYLVLSSKELEYTPLEFTKNYLQRAEWIHSFLLDIEIIKLYHQNNFWPQNGANCFNFFRECEHFQTCGLKLENQVPPKSWVMQSQDDTVYQIELSLMDLIETQLDRE